ncbi:MAG: choice-of-anchor B family protein [Flavobacteriaceae bacterium]|nr:choice-of-anchor B family protein [Flavobacteriaceae bacterium]
MKKISLLVILYTALSFGQTPCTNGFAGQYPCNGYNLLSHITATAMGASGGNDIWGWTDPQDGKEYAIVGLDNGTAFVDITDPISPIYLGKLPSTTGSATARDIKTYNNFAFVVSDNNGNHGMQIFDLTRLRNVANPPETFTVDVLYSDFENAHNLAINEETGYAYACRTNLFGGGVHLINIQDPLNPINEGGVSGVLTHDAQIVIYNGPDTEYTGREILFSYNGFDEDVTIVDVTDKASPQFISNFTYSNNEHAHQGWLTENHEYIIMGDESDELNLGLDTRTIIFDISDLDNPTESFVYFGPTGATDHNGYVKGNTYYLANYNAGMRVIDISGIDSGTFTEIGFFDVYPDNNASGFNGAWSVYPYFASGNLIISSRGGDGGLFVVSENILGISSFENSIEFTMVPNPASEIIEINLSEDVVLLSANIYDNIGRLVLKSKDSTSINITSLKSGVYLVKLETDLGTLTKRLIKN